jgi:uncharacterized protein YcbX
VSDALGTVAGLWRYPVKSMQGEPVDRVAAGELGLAGDRAWAIIDSETGKVASAKQPKLWLTLLECAAAYVDEPPPDGDAAPIRITLPDGREVGSDDPDRDRLLSEAIGREVTLESRVPENATYALSRRDAQGLEVDDPESMTETGVGLVAPPGRFFDTSTLHVIATSTLERMAEAHPDGDWDTRRFRPNVLVTIDDPPADGFVEAGWIGQTLELGADTRAQVLAQMPRCVMTTVPQGELPRDPLILRALAEQNRQQIPGYGAYACIGALTNVSAPGTLAVGDDVALAA